MNGTIELILLPVSDVDRAKQFYVDTCGFEVIVDHAPNEHFRIVQCQPSGSSCSIGFGIGLQLDTEPGSVRGIHVMVSDVVAAREELAARGVEIDPVIHFNADGTSGEGPQPDRADYGSFAHFRDPDGNSWLLQERGYEATG